MELTFRAKQTDKRSRVSAAIRWRKLKCCFFSPSLISPLPVGVITLTLKKNIQMLFIFSWTSKRTVQVEICWKKNCQTLKAVSSHPISKVLSHIFKNGSQVKSLDFYIGCWTIFRNQRTCPADKHLTSDKTRSSLGWTHDHVILRQRGRPNFK